MAIITVEDVNRETLKDLIAPITFLVILLIFGVLGNLSVLIIYRKYTQSVYITVIWNLAIIDFTFSLFGIPFNIARLRYFYTFKEPSACKFFTTLLTFGILYSTHVIILLSFHRFRQVCRPHQWQISVDRVKYWIAGCFAVAILFSWPQAILIDLEKKILKDNLTEITFIEGNLTGSSLIGSICPITPSKKSQTRYWTSYNTILLCLFASYNILLLMIYLCIGRNVYKQRRRMSTHNTSKTSAMSNQSYKMTKIALTIAVVFATSYIPLFLLKVAKNWFDEENITTVEFVFLRIGERFYIVNHVANPFIYAAFDNRYRKQISDLLSCKLRRSQKRETGIRVKNAKERPMSMTLTLKNIQHI